jgi:hypothetical protein
LKVQRKISPTTIVEADGQTVAEGFDNLARLEAVFGGDETCGLCGKAGVRYECQSDKEGNVYRKAVCRACGAEFRFGLRKGDDGILFPQLKDKDGHQKPNKGWAKWQPQEQQASHGRQYRPQEHGDGAPF